MSERELSTLLREAEPRSQHLPADAGDLWAAGRRRARRARTVWGAGVLVVVLIVAGAVVRTAGGRDSVPLDVAGPPPEADSTGTTPVTDPAVPEPGPTAPPDAHLPSAEGFPYQLRIDRTTFRAGDGGEAEAALVPVAEAGEDVTVAIPMTLDRWDPAAASWAPAFDLYDMSGGGEASWQPHGTHRAWYEWVGYTHGFPLRLPVDELEPGVHRVCLQAWRAVDGTPGVPTERPSGTMADPGAASLDELTIPPSAVHLCAAISIVAPDEVDPGSVAGAPTLVVDRLGLHVAILDATGENLQDAVGVVAGTPRPGEPGTSVVIGHRTTWSAPFLNLDQLRPGDRIRVIDGDRSLQFDVVATRIVAAPGPSSAPTFGIPASELAPGGHPAPGLRLVTFNPRYSAAERLIVDAVLVGTAGG